MYKAFKLFEKIFAFLQGKGYGTGTVKNEVRMVKKLVKNIQLAFDIGGNKGAYSKYIRKYFPNSKVYIFEPAQKNVETLQHLFKDDSQVKVLPYAVSDFNGKTTLFSDQEGSGMASLSQRNLKHFNKEMDILEEVSVITFLEYYEQHFNNQVIDFVKLDVEGHELSVLKGMKDSIRKIRCLQFEFGGCNLDTRTTFQDFWYYLTDRGFAIYRITPLGLMPIPKYEEADEFYRTTNYVCLNTVIAS